ncbi:hypothetical protein [Elizabethkingia ursingii]
MKTLEQIKDEVAEELGHITWSNMIHLYGSVQTSIVDKVSKLYAREVAQASLDKAAENAELYYCNNIHSLKRHQDTYLETDPGWYVALDKQSIINNQNIIIL